MVMNSQYQKRVIIRKVMIDGYGDIKDFNGKTIDVENFAFKHGIQVTPTLQFVDAKGHQLAPEMVGYNTPEMYPAYLDNAIEESQRAITLAP
jgi:thioredoxin-related protein